MSKIKIVDSQTGEEIIRDLTPEEFAELKILEENGELRAQQVAEAAAKRTAAEAKLAALGLTADDLKALGL